ncbi:MAG: hypothetical protein SGI98_08765 [Verrucomicrobiota bacterium]|nr:hypothetical protein [Verrucomicrobiota bacterium]
MFFTTVKELLKAKWIPVVGVILGILIGMLLMPTITVIIRNYHNSAPSGEITENSGLIKKLQSFFATKSYDTIIEEQRLNRLDKLVETDKAALVGIDNAMNLTVEELSKKQIQIADSATNAVPTLIVPEYLKK